ncbi:MAG TPA: CPXCG motif-containing cysteine-rich protein [Gemmatimonadales bacterium]
MEIGVVDFGDDPLDEEFPLGDPAPETEAAVVCPYCGEVNEIALDAGGGAFQEYEEDCQVCCRPWRVTVTYDDAGGASVTAVPLDD